LRVLRRITLERANPKRQDSAPCNGYEVGHARSGSPKARGQPQLTLRQPAASWRFIHKRFFGSLKPLIFNLCYSGFTVLRQSPFKPPQTYQCLSGFCLFYRQTG
jgi:hypothetical protein